MHTHNCVCSFAHLLSAQMLYNSKDEICITCICEPMRIITVEGVTTNKPSHHVTI
ncbi:hypothetical protein HanXRQr2_Chr16g0758731 [Helianthus annuus]|uniref:Uncharacterized protein n=1 Tax=Helianthus annuus TaxID=4232 RepID=A0A9K3DSI9_HELAN|nr:hypothetical protein HanXRQr2_Chr16g0758731 [Helianthus annuus]KAJ0822019.1 hypothetical protein HanPSC8_Chr16g0727121 [Helianthus annuus]